MFTEDPARIPVHLRDVTFRSFLRPDGLWDIEGTLHDSKAYAQTPIGRSLQPAGAPMHHMQIRLTIDDAMVIQVVESAMPATPFPDSCQPAAAPLQKLIGVKIGAGWRKAIAERMGGEAGCTHLRELLAGLGTAAIQTVRGYRAHQRRESGQPEVVLFKPRPPMGECLSWAFNGPVISAHFPQFIGWVKPPKEHTAHEGQKS
jgi:hypothetical protein